MSSLLLRLALLAGAPVLAATPSRAGALYNATALTATNGYQPTVEGLDNNGRVFLWNSFAPAGAPAYLSYSARDGKLTTLVSNDAASYKTQYIPQYTSGDGQMTIGWVAGKPVLSHNGQTTELPNWGRAVNDSGQVAVLNSAPNATTSAIVTNGTVTPVGTLPGYDSTGVGGLNNSGEASATVTRNLSNLDGSDNYSSQPAYFDGKRLIPLGTFGGSHGYAAGINNNGDVIGVADTPNSTGPSGPYEMGFVSHKGGPLVPLIMPGHETEVSVPTSINDKGQIVGHMMYTGIGAFLYQNGVMTDLNSLLSPSTKLKVNDAYFINNLGQIIAEGFLNGSKWPQLVLLTPDDQPLPKSPEPLVEMVPEPSTLAVFALLLAGVAARRKRRSPGGRA